MNITGKGVTVGIEGTASNWSRITFGPMQEEPKDERCKYAKAQVGEVLVFRSERDFDLITEGDTREYKKVGVAYVRTA